MSNGAVIAWVIAVLLAVFLYAVNIGSAIQSERTISQWRTSDVICAVGMLPPLGAIGAVCGAVHSYK